MAAIDEVLYPGRARLPGTVNPAVQVRGVTVVYPGGNVGLDDVSLTVERGEFAFLVGATGCGKSTSSGS